MARTILIKQGRVIDPSQNLDGEMDILLEGQRVAGIHKTISTKASITIPAKGKYVLPGLIDMHCHLREPGRPDKETIASGTRSAALGGFTTVVCMPNTDPPIDNESTVAYVVSKAKADGVVNVLPVAAITKGRAGRELSEMGILLERGAVAFSDDGGPVGDTSVMRRALEYAGRFRAAIISHCEDVALACGGVMNEGALSTKMGLRGWPALAEEVMVARDIMLASEFCRKNGSRLHIAHVSTRGSVELVRRAKADGIAVTCETAPHYFTLTEEAVEGYNTLAKVNPPLRTKDDIVAIVKGLKDGTIDAIATDHAPHTIDDKNVEFEKAAFGMTGFETALPLALTELVDTGALSLIRLVEKFTSGPARILGINKGSLKVGSDADITIVDPANEYTYDASKSPSKSRNTPFSGYRLKGSIEITIVSGNIIVKAGGLEV